MKTVYIKKYIKSVDDLPKEKGVYAASIEGEMGEEYFRPDKEFDENHWLEDIEWYLLPVELPDEKEIEGEIMKINRSESLCTVDYYSTGFNAVINWLINKLIKP